MSKYAYKRSSPARSSSESQSRDDEGRFGLTRNELLVLAIAIARIWDTLYGTSKSYRTKPRGGRQDPQF
jgi:hypothetical protein